MAELKQRVESFMNARYGQNQAVVDLVGALYRAVEQEKAWRSSDNKSLSKEIDDLEESLQALQNKLGDNCCACSYDKKDDVCSVHAPRIKDLTEQNEKAIETLRFYADDNNYINGVPSVTIIKDFGEEQEGKLFSGTCSFTNCDYGFKARATLKALGVEGY